MASNGRILSKRQKVGWLIFSVLLWAQLVFTVGLTAWRYQLVLFSGGEVYVSNVSPGTEQFAAFADQNCPENMPFAYVSSHYRGASRFRYELYPRRPTNLSTAVAGDPSFATAVQLMQADQIACLVVDYLDVAPPIVGERRVLNADQYLIILPGAAP